jgi:hypothetical protein
MVYLHLMTQVMDLAVTLNLFTSRLAEMRLQLDEPIQALQQALTGVCEGMAAFIPLMTALIDEANTTRQCARDIPELEVRFTGCYWGCDECVRVLYWNDNNVLIRGATCGAYANMACTCLRWKCRYGAWFESRATVLCFWGYWN